MQVSKAVGAVLVGFMLLATPGKSLTQFKFERVEDIFRFEPERPISFYTRSSYDRVQGVFLNAGLNVRPSKVEGLRLYGDVGYGFKNELRGAKWYEIGDDGNLRWRYHVGVQKDFFTINRLSLGVELFDFVETRDNWAVSRAENALAALLFREDFYDYFGANGVRFFVDHRFRESHTLRAELRRQSYDQLKRNTNWSVFGGDKRFRPNPNNPAFPILPGDETSLALMGAFDWRDNPIFPLFGWYVEVMYERTWNQLPTQPDLNTDGLFVSVKRYQPTFDSQRFTARLLLGSRTGSLGDQHLMDLGGVGSLRGFREKEFIGNRFLLINANYLFGGTLLQKIPLEILPFWETMSLGVFIDSGYAWLVDPEASLFDLGDFGLDDLKTNIGLSFLLSEGLIRIDVARRLADGDPKWRVTVRVLESL